MGGANSHRQNLKGRQSVCFPENIEGQANKLFDDLQAVDYLQNLDAQTFSRKAAHFLAELNAIHAFREGNGRSQLTFFAMLADDAGHPLNIDKMDPDEMLTAMIASFDGDEHRLANVIEGLIK
jgi:cell filamentation protein